MVSGDSDGEWQSSDSVFFKQRIFVAISILGGRGGGESDLDPRRRRAESSRLQLYLQFVRVGVSSSA